MAILQIGTAPEADTGALEASFRLFMRLVALSCLVAGLQYWGRLIGLSDGGMSRFDLIPYYWQLASAALAVLLPVAAVGLWMQVSWGPVIWVVAAGSEIVMHKGFPLWYGERPVAGHRPYRRDRGLCRVSRRPLRQAAPGLRGW